MASRWLRDKLSYWRSPRWRRPHASAVGASTLGRQVSRRCAAPAEGPALRLAAEAALVIRGVEAGWRAARGVATLPPQRLAPGAPSPPPVAAMRWGTLAPSDDSKLLGVLSQASQASPQRLAHDSYLVDSASSHMLVSKIKPCMSKYKQLYGETANGSLYKLSFI